MQIIDRFPDGTIRTVDLTATEVQARAFFEQLLDAGYGIEFSADLVADQYRGTGDCGLAFCQDCNQPSIDPEFIDYLKN